MNSIININKTNYFKSDYWDLRLFPDENFSSFYKNAGIGQTLYIDFSSITDLAFNKILKQFLIYKINTEKITAKKVHKQTVIPLIYFINFIKDKHIKTYLDLTEDIKNKYYEYIPSKNTSNRYTCIFNQIKKFAMDFGKDYFDKDIWSLFDFNISDLRINKGNRKCSYDFSLIENNINKIITKKFMQYLITGTDLTNLTIYRKFNHVIDFVTFIKFKDIYDLNRYDMENYIEYLTNKNLQNKGFNSYINDINEFQLYLESNNYMKKCLICKQDLRKENYKCKISSVDKYIINQIFNKLDKIEFKYQVAFLILYCTGMRISELVVLNLNCIYKTDNGYFIKFHSQKMKKEVTNIIPKNLFEMIQVQIKSILNDFGKDEIYLFPSQKNKNYTSESISNNLKQYFIELGVKNNDGTTYIFKPHDYRHTMAVNMLEANIPFQFIQNQLHHESPEMTLAYLELNDKRKILKMNNFININGDKLPVSTEIKVEGDLKAELLREYINTQILTNGVCGKPVKLGKCPHANSCLTCSDFRTNIDYLEQHKDHLKRVEEYLTIAKENGWEMQIETNEEIRKNLIKIIDSLDKQGSVN